MKKRVGVQGECVDFASLRYAYAVSGGIGSGKSSVCQILSSLGYEIIDADLIAHKALDEMSDEVITEFGDGILDNGVVSRAKLGKIVFNDSCKLQKLNQILSLKIQSFLFEACMHLEKKERIYFVEIALLFEQIEIFDFENKLLIACSEENQIKRVMERNTLSQMEAEARIDSQMPLNQKLKRADFVLWNDGGRGELEQKVKQTLEKMMTLRSKQLI